MIQLPVGFDYMLLVTEFFAIATAFVPIILLVSVAFLIMSTLKKA